MPTMNFAFEPEQDVWFCTGSRRVLKDRISSVVWTDETVYYTLHHTPGYNFDMDDLFHSEESAQREADRLNG